MLARVNKILLRYSKILYPAINNILASGVMGAVVNQSVAWMVEPQKAPVAIVLNIIPVQNDGREETRTRE